MPTSIDLPAPDHAAAGIQLTRRDWLKAALAAGAALASGGLPSAFAMSGSASASGGVAPTPAPALLPSVYQASLKLQGVPGGAFAIVGWAAAMPTKLTAAEALASLASGGGHFRVEKDIDFATAEIMERAQAGKPSKKATLHVMRDGKLWLSAKFWDVTLTGVETRGDSSGESTESLTFAYKEADWRDHSLESSKSGDGDDDDGDDDSDDDSKGGKGGKSKGDA